MKASLINLTHTIGGLRVTERPRPLIRHGEAHVRIGLAGGEVRYFRASADVEVGGYVERFAAGRVKSMAGPRAIDFAERESGFRVSRKPR
jgi:hypothetical protein